MTSAGSPFGDTLANGSELLATVRNERLVSDLDVLSHALPPSSLGRAVVAIGDSAAAERLRPLLRTTDVEDPHDDLFGCALQALWPQLLSPEELFESLHRPRDESRYGAYAAFLRDGAFLDLKMTIRRKRRETPVIGYRWARTSHDPSLNLLYQYLHFFDPVSLRPEVASHAGSPEPEGRNRGPTPLTQPGRLVDPTGDL
jgi:hypothetical protein